MKKLILLLLTLVLLSGCAFEEPKIEVGVEIVEVESEPDCETCLKDMGFEIECIEHKDIEKYRMVEYDECIDNLPVGGKEKKCEKSDRWTNCWWEFSNKTKTDCQEKTPYIHFWNETICIKEQLTRYTK